MAAQAPKTRAWKADLWLVCIIVINSCITGSSDTTNRFFQFVQDQSVRRYTRVSHEVLAVYYLWYGPGKSWGNEDLQKHEIANTARYPIKGAYDSHDPAILDWQIDQAKDHGITGFIASWWGVGDPWVEKGFQILMDRAEKRNFKVALYWEQAPDEGKGQIQRAVGELSYILKRYGTNSAFLKVDGRPVIFVYGRVMWQIPPNAWPEIISATREKAGDFVLIADGDQKNYALLFDGVHTYPDPGGDELAVLPRKAEQYYARIVNLARKHGRIACATVGPGYDDRKHNKPGAVTERQNGKRYKLLWEEAIRANPDWIIISTWNEWPEGTEIEPSIEFGDQYLNITSDCAQSFLHNGLVDNPSPAQPVTLTPSKRNISQLLGERSTLVLTQDRLNEAEFWASYCGATLKRGTWTDLIDPSQFNAQKFPLTLIIRGENFTGTIKKPDDVKQALARYLSQGGLLVILPISPWPLYYDDSLGGKPAAITDYLHLGVTSWSELPLPIDLSFAINTNALPGLETTSLFPTTGDLRWSGVAVGRVPKYDNYSPYYVPLVQLRDKRNRYFGEGAVYIEHQTPPVFPGKTIYVWMRTAEALGEDKFYPALFEFISKKQKLTSAKQ